MVCFVVEDGRIVSTIGHKGNELSNRDGVDDVLDSMVLVSLSTATKLQRIGRPGWGDLHCRCIRKQQRLLLPRLGSR